MLQVLRQLFESDTAGSEATTGTVTLRDLLRRGQLELWYQPKIELKTKRLVGAEGLVRCRRPDGSVIAPAADIRAACARSAA